MLHPESSPGSATASPAEVQLSGRCPCCGAVVFPPSQPRRFTITDGLILIGALGLAFGLARAVLVRPGLWSPWLAGLVVCVGLLVAGTPALFLLRLRQPRPSLRRLTRQPGFVALLVATSLLALALLTTGLLALVRLARQGMPARPGVAPDPIWWLGVLSHFGPLIGAAVAGAWVLLLCSGRRRPAQGGFDALGRLIGTAWIVLMVIEGCSRLAALRN